MANDLNAKLPPPEIVVEGDWSHFLRHPLDTYERARRAQQVVDEQLERELELEQREREREHEQREREHTAPGREEKSARRRRKEAIFFEVAETVVLPGMAPEKAWWAAGAALEQVKKRLKLKRLDDENKTTQDTIYRYIRKKEIWSRLTSLRKK